MSRSFTLTDPSTLDDLQVFLARAARIEEGSVRLIAGSGILAVYAAILYPGPETRYADGIEALSARPHEPSVLDARLRHIIAWALAPRPGAG